MMLMWLFSEVIYSVLESSIYDCGLVTLSCPRSEKEKTILTEVAILNETNENGLVLWDSDLQWLFSRVRQKDWDRVPKHPPGPDLALAQRDGTNFLGELHNVSKLVEVSSRVSARGHDVDEGGAGGGLLENHGQVWRLTREIWKKKAWQFKTTAVTHCTVEQTTRNCFQLRVVNFVFIKQCLYCCSDPAKTNRIIIAMVMLPYS